MTQAPIRYLIYSHHHFDHIAGGKAFKDAGATIVAHKRAKERLEVLKDPHTPLPDETIDTDRTITLGGTALELSYVGLNHSDSTLVMRLPREKIVFIVDLLPVGRMPGRGMIDFYPLEAEEFDQESARHGLGPANSRPSGFRRAARHQAGRAGAAHVAARGFCRDEKAGPRRQMLGYGRKRVQTAEIRDLAWL